MDFIFLNLSVLRTFSTDFRISTDKSAISFIVTAFIIYFSLWISTAWPWCGYYGLHFIYPAVDHWPWICGLIPSVSFGKFLVIICSNITFTINSLSSLSSLIINMLDLCCVLSVSCTFFACFQCIFLFQFTKIFIDPFLVH